MEYGVIAGFLIVMSLVIISLANCDVVYTVQYILCI